MEQAIIEQANVGLKKKRLPLSRVLTAAAAFAGAFVLVVLLMTFISDASSTDRVMTDEVKNIKVGYTVSGDSKPHGGLPELSQQINSGDFSAAQKTLGGINGKFASVTAELQRRSEGGTADREFAGSLVQIRSSLDSQNQAAAQTAVKTANSLWPQVEAELSLTQIDAGVLGKSLGALALAWALFTVGLVAMWEKGQPGKADETGLDQQKGGINLTGSRPIRALLASPVFPASLQGFGLVFLLMVLIAGLMGASNSESMATVLTWSLWWSPLMIISLVLLGKLWCGACPLGAITAVVERFGAGRRSPTFTRKHTLGILTLTPLAISITVFVLMRAELFGYIGVTSAAPVWTVVYFGIWIVPAIGVSLVYKRRAWCRYWCPASAVTSVTAKLSPINIVHGRSTGVRNCSTMEYPGNYLTSDKRCVYCFKCTQAYPGTPVMARLRLPGSAIVRERHIFAEAAMAVIIVAVFPISHGLGQLDFFKNGLVNQIHLSYFVAVVGTLAAYAGVSRIGASMSGESFHENFARYGVAYLPIGVLFSLGQAITGMLGKSGAMMNSLLPFFGVHGYSDPSIVSSSTYASVQMWTMSWMASIGGIGALALIWALARRHKTPGLGWLPHVVLVVIIIILAKALPMPVH